MKLQAILGLASLWLGLTLGAGCGAGQGQGISDEDSPRWWGDLTIGTQCPYGMVSDTRKGLFKLTDCPLPIESLGILETPGPILFSGDCKEKILAIRSGDLTLDSLWQVFPNDEFDLSAGPVFLRLSEDQDGHQNCWSQAQVRVRGALRCRDQDRMDIRFDEFSLELTQPSTPDQAPCHLPPGCRLTSTLQIGQCL